MKVTNKAVDEHQVMLTVEVPSAEVNKGVAQAVKRVADQVNIPGFRKGKTPRKILESRFGKDVILSEATDILVNKFYNEALQAEKLTPVNQPDVDVQHFAENEDMKFTATFTKKPTVKLGEYKGLEVERKNTKVTDAMLEEQLTNFAKQQSKLVVAEDAELQDGDLAMIDFAGKIDGKAFDGGEGKSYPLEIGSQSFIPGFEDQLKGHKVDDEVLVKVPFPEEYFVKELAGKEAEFTVNILDIKRREMPELNDDFAKAIGGFESIDQLRDVMRNQMQEQITARETDEYHNELVKLAVANSEVNIPEVMVEARIDQMIEELKLNLESRNMNIDTYLENANKDLTSIREDYQDAALTNVRTDLVLEAICDAEELEVRDSDLNMELYRMAQSFGADPKDVWEIIRKEGRVGMLAGTVARKKAAQVIVATAKGEEPEAAEEAEKVEE